MTTRYHPSYLTAGCWSPTRPGVFYVTRMDGVVDVWDYFYRQNEVAYSHKVGESALSSIAVQGSASSGGRLVAVGDVNGTVSLLEVCEGLAQPQNNEKIAIANMFEREMKREKNLEVRRPPARPRGLTPLLTRCGLASNGRAKCSGAPSRATRPLRETPMAAQIPGWRRCSRRWTPSSSA